MSLSSILYTCVRTFSPSLCCVLQWEPVDYFNNKIICDLVEEKHKGIIAILDEECLRPGDVSDDTFLSKLSQSVGNHPHFVSHKTTDYEGRKELDRDVSAPPATCVQIGGGVGALLNDG